MSSDVSALFLDVGGVLLKPDPAALRAALGPGVTHPDDEAFDRALYRHGRVGAGLGPGDDDDDFVLRFVMAAGVPEDLARAHFRELRACVLERPWALRDPAKDAAVLHTLAKLVPHLVIVSNAEGGTAALLARHGLCQLGEGPYARAALVIDSLELGVHKPDPEIYRRAAAAIGVDPARCLHVGDSVRNDVHAAEAAGLTALHFCPYGDCRDPEHGHVTSLDQLVSHVGV